MSSERVDLKVSFPFDLNNLFNLSYSFDVLKQSIEYLAIRQEEHDRILMGGGSAQIPPNK
jgi:hypothetical protein